MLVPWEEPQHHATASFLHLHVPQPQGDISVETRPHSRAVAVRDAIALVAPLAVTLVAEGCVQAGGPQVAPCQAQATLIHVRTAGIRPACGEGHRQPQALPHPQGAVPPTQRPREVPLEAPGGGERQRRGWERGDDKETRDQDRESGANQKDRNGNMNMERKTQGETKER